LCCTLATSTFLRSSRGSSPWAASPTTKSNTRGFGIGRRSLAKNLTLGDRFRNPVRLFSNQSRGDPCYHKPDIWQVARSCYPIAQEWDVALRPKCHTLQSVSSSGGGLFKRPVILWIRDASYLW